MLFSNHQLMEIEMSKMFCVVHKDDAKWMMGEEYCNGTWHAVKHQFYNLDIAKDAIRNGPKHHVLLGASIIEDKRYFDKELIQVYIPA